MTNIRELVLEAAGLHRRLLDLAIAAAMDDRPLLHEHLMRLTTRAGRRYDRRQAKAIAEATGQ